MCMNMWTDDHVCVFVFSWKKNCLLEGGKVQVLCSDAIQMMFNTYYKVWWNFTAFGDELQLYYVGTGRDSSYSLSYM